MEQTQPPLISATAYAPVSGKDATPFSQQTVVLTKQAYGLLGEGRGILAAHWCIRRSGNEWWLSLFHKLMLYQLFLESPVFSDGHDGVPESLQVTGCEFC